MSYTPIKHLFEEGRGFSTVMFWLAFFMCLFMVYSLSSWHRDLHTGPARNDRGAADGSPQVGVGASPRRER